jgi:O-antigen/teichoic acid export membrane protein
VSSCGACWSGARPPDVSRLTRNIGYNLAGQVVLSLLARLAVRVIFRRLGADAVGLILFTQTLNLVLVSLLELGIVAITVREVAAHFAGDRSYVSDLLRTAATFYWGAYLVLGGALLLIAPIAVGHWINLTTLSPASATLLIRILGLGSLLLLPRALYASLFRGLQRMAIVNVIEVGAIALQQLGILTIVAKGGDLTAVAVWIGISYLASVVAYIAMAAGVVGAGALLPGYRAAVVRRNAGFALHMVTISTAGMLHSQSDKLAISKLLPVGVLGTYAFASTLVAGVGRVTLSLVQAAFPSFAALAHRQSREPLMRQYRLLQAVVVYGTAPLFAAMGFATLPLFTFVFDGTVASSLVVPVLWLCAGFYMNGTLSVPYYFSLAVGKPEIAARQNLLAVVVVLPVVVAATAVFGLAGAAFSWVFYHLFAYACSVPRICRECLHVKTVSWYRQVGKAAALVAGSYGVTAIGLLLSHRVSLAGLAIAFVLGSALYAALGYLLAWPELRREWRYAARETGVAIDPAA